MVEEIGNRFVIKVGYSSSKQMNICLISDDNYFRYLLIALNSLISTNSPNVKLDIYLILDNVSDENKSRLCILKNENVDFHIIDYSSTFAKIRNEESKYINNSTYIRLNIPQLIPNQVDRLLYLDVDIVVRSNLYSLYHIDLCGNVLAAVRDMSMSHLHKKNKLFSYMMHDIADIDYFNAGIIVMDLKKMRDDDFSHLARRCYDEHKEFKFADQDILNFIYRKKTKYISCKWNLQLLFYIMDNEWSKDARDIAVNNKLFNSSYSNIENLLADASILHFLGDKKKMYSRFDCIKTIYDSEICKLENKGIQI